MNNELVSIIIPAYNAEKRIKNCLNSIKKQTYKNIEVVIINDGSIDKTKEILDNYDFGHLKKIIINQNNMGVSKSRNTGILNSTGNFILFLDSDDTLEYAAIEYMKKNMDKNLDAVKCSYSLDYKRKKIKSKEEISSGIKTTSEIKTLVMDILIGKIQGFSCLYLIRKEFLINNKIFFPDDVRFMEDLIFITKMLEKANSIFVLDKPILNYYQSNSSVSKTININERLKNINYRHTYSKKYFIGASYKYTKEFINKITEMYVKTEKYILKEKNISISNYNKKIYNMIIDMLEENDFSIRQLNFKNKILIFLIRHDLQAIIKLIELIYSLWLKVKGESNYD